MVRKEKGTPSLGSSHDTLYFGANISAGDASSCVETVRRRGSPHCKVENAVQAQRRGTPERSQQDAGAAS